MKKPKSMPKKSIETKKSATTVKAGEKTAPKDLTKLFSSKYQDACKLIANKLQDVFAEYKNVDSINIPILNEQVVLQEITESQPSSTPNTIETISLNTITREASFTAEMQPTNDLSVLSKQFAQIAARTEDQFILDALTSPKELMQHIEAKEGCKIPYITQAIARVLAIGNDRISSSKQINHIIAPASLLEVLRNCISEKDTTPYVNIFSDLVNGKCNEVLGFKFHWISQNWAPTFPTDCLFVFSSMDGIRLFGGSSIAIRVEDDTKPNNYTITITVKGNAKVLNPKNIICVSI